MARPQWWTALNAANAPASCCKWPESPGSSNLTSWLRRRSRGSLNGRIEAMRSSRQRRIDKRRGLGQDDDDPAALIELKTLLEFGLVDGPDHASKAGRA